MITSRFLESLPRIVTKICNLSLNSACSKGIENRQCDAANFIKKNPKGSWEVMSVSLILVLGKLMEKMQLKQESQSILKDESR